MLCCSNPPKMLLQPCQILQKWCQVWRHFWKIWAIQAVWYDQMVTKKQRSFVRVNYWLHEKHVLCIVCNLAASATVILESKITAVISKKVKIGLLTITNSDWSKEKLTGENQNNERIILTLNVWYNLLKFSFLPVPIVKDKSICQIGKCQIHPVPSLTWIRIIKLQGIPWHLAQSCPDRSVYPWEHLQPFVCLKKIACSCHKTVWSKDKGRIKHEISSLLSCLSVL